MVASLLALLLSVSGFSTMETQRIVPLTLCIKLQSGGLVKYARGIDETGIESIALDLFPSRSFGFSGYCSW
jgi:hypothetical protein